MSAFLTDVRKSLPAAAWWAVCSAVAVLFLFPLAEMIFQSIKPATEANASPPTLFPHGLSLDNFIAIFSGNLGVGASFVTSIVVGLCTTAFCLVVSTLAGYAFARLQFPGSKICFFLVLVTFMISFQAIATPLYLTLSKIHLINSLTGLVLVVGTFQLPFGLFIMRNSFAAVPRAIEEAAMIDGCGIGRTLRAVMLPIVVPGILTTGLFAFFASWNEFFAPLIFLSDQSKYTLPVMLSILQTGQQGSLNWGTLEAGVVLTAMPCIVLFVMLQRYYVGGLVSGAVK